MDMRIRNMQFKIRRKLGKNPNWFNKGYSYQNCIYKDAFIYVYSDYSELYLDGDEIDSLQADEFGYEEKMNAFIDSPVKYVARLHNDEIENDLAKLD